MKTKQSTQGVGSAAFEALEARVLLDGALPAPALGEGAAGGAPTEEIHVAVEHAGVPDEKDVDIDNDGKSNDDAGVVSLLGDATAAAADADGDGKLSLPDRGDPGAGDIDADGVVFRMLGVDNDIDTGASEGPVVAADLLGEQGSVSYMIGIHNSTSQDTDGVSIMMGVHNETSAESAGTLSRMIDVHNATEPADCPPGHVCVVETFCLSC